MPDRRDHRPTGLELAALSSALGAAAGLALEHRHLRRIARDAELAALSRRSEGSPIRVRSADGTSLQAEVLQRFGEDVEAVLAASVGEGARAIVVGHSLGAMSIAAWAERHDVAARACGAALVNAGFGGLIAGSLLLPQILRWLNERLARRVLLGSQAPLPRRSSPVQQAVIRYCAFGPAATLGQVAFYERMLVACPPDVRTACGLTMADMDLRHAVARLRVPTLVVTGDCDKLTPPSHSHRIAETLPDLARLIELPDTGHMSPLERPAELSAALGTLVDGLAPIPGVPVA
jgi:pimeloyl-ACP methyl ester carboxylesterase